MIVTKKVRLRIEDQEIFYQCAGTARWAYNYTLRIQQTNYKLGGKFLSDSTIRKHLTKMKKTKYTWLSTVSNNITKQAVKDACNAYKSFFKGYAGFPKPKTKRKTKPSFYHDPHKLKVREKEIRLEKVGWVKTSEQIPVEVKYYNPRVTYDGKYWYLSVGTDKEVLQTKLENGIVGIDIGIKKLAVTSDGKFYKNINKTASVRKAEKRLKRLQRQASRKYRKGKPKSNNLIKCEKRLRLQHRRLKNIRTNYIHQVSTEIVKTKPSRIVMETLNTKGMMKNRHLARSIANQRLHDFKSLISYKSEKYGIEFVEADKWFPSSKTCNSCGQVNKKLKLQDRTYHCNCGFSCDRDLNASYNLRDYTVL